MEYLVNVINDPLSRHHVDFHTNILYTRVYISDIEVLVCAEASRSHMYSVQAFPLWVNLPLRCPRETSHHHGNPSN